MLDLGSLGEILIIGTIALVIIGPKEMPIVMRKVGKWIYKLRLLSLNLRQEFDSYIQKDSITDEKSTPQSEHFPSFLSSKETSCAEEAELSLKSSQKSLYKSNDRK